MAKRINYLTAINQAALAESFPCRGLKTHAHGMLRVPLLSAGVYLHSAWNPVYKDTQFSFVRVIWGELTMRMFLN